MLCWNHRPLAHLSLLFAPSLLLLSTFSLLPSFVPSQKLPPSMQGQTEPIPSNLSELFTKEPNWPIEDFDERKQPKKRKDNQLTSRYGLRIDHCPDGGEPELDSLNGQVKLCQLDDECRPSYKCQNIIGLTHFGKQMRYCCPTKTTACTEKPKLEPVIPGQCRPLRTFYYFDIEQLACVKARMAQCEDFGRNRFASKCETTACELGESILLHNSSFDKPFVCQSDEDCPVGYNCRQDHIFRRSVCCGFLDFEPCPLGFRSFTVPFSGRPKTCVNSDTRDECPTDYVCTQNQLNQEHYCCTVENGVCPEGHQAYIHPLTDGTIKCNLKGYESTTSCPPGYACLAAVFGSSWGFCCSQAVVASCPEDSYPQINALTNQPQRCEMMQSHACAKGFICESDSVSHLGFCCSVPRRSSKKKTHPPELIPRKKAIRPIPQTTVEPEEEDIAAEETAATTKMPSTTTEKASPEVTFVATTTSRGKRKGDWKSKGRKKTKKKGGGTVKADSGSVEQAIANKDSDEGSSSPSSSSDEKSEDREEVAELSTKLDRYITGLRRRTALPRGHRPKPRIWKLKKGSGLGQELIPVPTRRKGKIEELEIDEMEELPEDEESRWKHKLKRRHPRPRCPSNYRSMEYPGTKWNYLECFLDGRNKKKHRKKDWEEDEEDGDADDAEAFSSERKRHRSHQCPKPAVCLKAKNDPFHRALCCLKRRTESEQEQEEEEEEQQENEAEGSEEIEESTNGFEKGEERRKAKKKAKIKRKEKELGEDEEGQQQQEEGDGINEDDNEEHEQKIEKEEAAERERMAEELAAIREREAEMEAALNKGNRRTPESAVSVAITATTTISITTTTRSPRPVNVLMVEKSNDPACPRLIADRVCAPGSTKDCREPGFFCQFNKEKHQFVCCAKK